MFDLDILVRKFEIFTQNYLNSDSEFPENFNLKYSHTFNVLENCFNLTKATELEEKIINSALTACLFHDIGRFPQFKKYGTFNDNESVNHARLGVGVLCSQKFLTDLPDQMRRTVYGAIALHNRRSIPENIRQELKTVTEIVRDCDKIDIMRVLLDSISSPDENGNVPFLGLKEIPEMLSENILLSINKHQSALYSDMKCVNDFRLMLLSWSYDLNFRWSRQEIIRRGYINKIFGSLPDVRQIKELRPEILKVLNQ
ncbi:HD domain-containing protein [Maridesulfovibrio bastinii]|uniref:HD domain-containing protein n=1 Tax=Maridesulfovibrio bastinii TaxID=47157 RepID=UPI0004014138|nr:HD domain-containing protein [Maridesulfovibrio bastinii]